MTSRHPTANLCPIASGLMLGARGVQGGRIARLANGKGERETAVCLNTSRRVEDETGDAMQLGEAQVPGELEDQGGSV